MSSVVLQTVLMCPDCGEASPETMPVAACQWFYECRHCSAVLKPLSGDCCVYCSYGSVPCPPMQTGGGCCDLEADR